MAKIYPISPPQINADEFAPQLRVVLAKHQPKYFQLRLKEITPKEIVFAAKKLIPICHEFGTKFIMNDFVDLALETNSDGVHVSSDDDIAHIKKTIGNKILGVSCYNSIELAEAAVKAGADYISFGAFYPTTTKSARAKAEIATLEKFKSKYPNVEVTAIGGINFENSEPLIKAGANQLCMISALWAKV